MLPRAPTPADTRRHAADTAFRLAPTPADTCRHAADTLCQCEIACRLQNDASVIKMNEKHNKLKQNLSFFNKNHFKIKKKHKKH